MRTFKKLILDDLKSQGLERIIPHIKSVTHDKYSGGSSLNVSTLDLLKTDREKLSKLLDAYKQGDFNGMTDSYEHREDNGKERKAKFVFLRNTFSDDIRLRVINYLKETWQIVDDTTAQNKMQCWYDQLVHRILVDIVSLNPLKIG